MTTASSHYDKVAVSVSNLPIVSVSCSRARLIAEGPTAEQRVDACDPHGGPWFIGVGCWLQTLIGPDSSALALIPGLVVTELGVGLAIPTLTAAALSTAPPELGGMVAAALNTARQLGFALGVAVGLIFRTTVEQRSGDPDLVATVAAGQAPRTPEISDAVACPR